MSTSTCRNCGGLLDTAPPARCRFCDALNEAGPTEVAVPVPVQIIQHVVHVNAPEDSSPSTAAATRPRAPGVPLCPRCDTALVSVVADEITLSGCARCGGVWVDNESAGRLLASPQRMFIELAERAAANASAPGIRGFASGCPSCGGDLQLTDECGVLVDVCEAHGVWFDANELPKFLDGAAHPERFPSRRLADLAPDEIVECAVCASKLAAALANVGEAGLTCDRCWRERQHALFAGDPDAPASWLSVFVGDLLGRPRPG